jgi:hypothetical protein
MRRFCNFIKQRYLIMKSTFRLDADDIVIIKRKKKKHHHHCHKPKKKKIRLKLLSVSSTIANFSFHILKSNKIMFTAKDTDVLGKHIDITIQIPLDEAGNLPAFVAGSFTATSTNEEVATVEVVSADDATGTYVVSKKFTGKLGSADASFSINPDVDGSGDPLLTAMFTSVITAPEASTLGVTASDLIANA